MSLEVNGAITALEFMQGYHVVTLSQKWRGAQKQVIIPCSAVDGTKTGYPRLGGQVQGQCHEGRNGEPQWDNLKFS